MAKVTIPNLSSKPENVCVKEILIITKRQQEHFRLNGHLSKETEQACERKRMKTLIPSADSPTTVQENSTDNLRGIKGR